MSDLIVREEDLVNNPTARVPICLVLDTSSSMKGDPIYELSQGVKLFLDEIRNDEHARYAADICIITFGDEVKVCKFSSIGGLENPVFEAEGGTPMGEAVNKAIDLLAYAKNEYSSRGIDYYQPWMVLMTDGQPTDDIRNAAIRTSELVSSRKLSIFPIGIGNDADLNELAKFSPKRSPLRLKGLNFKELFEWLSKSISKVSQSTPGDKIELDQKGIQGWGEL